MTNYQLGLLIGFSLGAVGMFVGLGIIGLFLEVREEKRDAAIRQAVHEKMPETVGIPAPTDYTHPDHFFASTLKEPPTEDDKEKTVVCTLLIQIEQPKAN
jgi:hypothetical protein